MDKMISKIQHQRMPDLVMEQLMDWIMDGRLHMGQKLVTEDIAQQMGISRMPVREAVKNLEKLGIVESIPYAGARLSHLSKDDVRQTYMMRKALEPIAGFYACQCITDEEVHEIEQIQQLFEEEMQSEQSSAKQVFLHNREFHFAIYRASRMERLCDVIERLWAGLAFCKLIYGQTYVTDKRAAEQMILEHRNYLNDLRARDAEGLQKRLLANLQKNEIEVPEKIAEYLDEPHEIEEGETNK